jgi:16S rRNA (adenine1518-N6/adenine1519-N6)-dimethyltransferase
MTVRAKKNLGQHFLTDKNIARKIVESLQKKDIQQVLEVGPGMGVLTQYLLEERGLHTYVVEIDRESVTYLHEHFPNLGDHIISGDFLKMNLSEHLSGAFSLIGNFPYNISSQIFFRVLDYRNQIPEVVGMVQKEVAERIAAGPGSKTYGILSVLLQAWYDIEYLFTVHEHVFSPPPKVKSAVIRLTRNEVSSLACSEKMLFTVVKQSFNQRRKTLRNSLKGLVREIDKLDATWLKKRPEQLSVKEFIELTREIETLLTSES